MRDPALVAPAAQGSGDPRFGGGAFLEVYGGNGEFGVLQLPASGSTANRLEDTFRFVCAYFGGNIRRDRPGFFLARDAGVAPQCSAPPTTTTTTTTTTTLRRGAVRAVAERGAVPLWNGAWADRARSGKPRSAPAGLRLVSARCRSAGRS